MTTAAEVFKIDAEHISESLKDAGAKLAGSSGEAVLDFSLVRRIDPRCIRALEELAGLAEAKAVRVALRGVNVEIYKVLKLVKLTSRFSFMNHAGRDAGME
jgi:anti-anti-sigma regulatory factor